MGWLTGSSSSKDGKDSRKVSAAKNARQSQRESRELDRREKAAARASGRPWWDR
jgi:hypothetical protein